ncbi:unnamed protein product [Didymodactylos carnosus]|uniref:Tetratricopeptide repeat domain 12 n=1 Tax=Didymodactylos carnosus TaxID=1234261 RepID=A0A813XXV8_9BILA|nr:unnamed protein product [Didymodactylos carnosus]CAF3659337.1 unnamed protein product [Didymodactylos carnosus]
MSAFPADPELDDFLSKVDEIQNIVKDLSSNDERAVKTAMERSDVIINANNNTKQGVNRTLINKSVNASTTSTIPQDAFMKSIEEDARQRGEDRKKRRKLADESKIKGNDAFKSGKYEQAIGYYTEGIQLLKDYDVLYTNRAQAFIKLEKYKEAIDDCDWALKIKQNFIKALTIKGKCYMLLKQFDNALEQFNQAKKIAITNYDSDTKRIIEQGSELERQKLINKREQEAHVFLQNEDPSTSWSIASILKKLFETNNSLLYYCGGIQLLNEIIIDETTRTTFRVNNGFQLFYEHPIIKQMFLLTDTMTIDEENLLNSLLNLMGIVSKDDDENGRLCLETEGITSFLNDLLFVKKNCSVSIIQSCLLFLVEISLSKVCRTLFLQKFSLEKVVPKICGLISASFSNDIQQNAARFLSNLAFETRFKQFIIDAKEKQQYIEQFQSLLTSIHIDEEARTLLLSVLTNLSSDKNLRKLFINTPVVFTYIVNLLVIDQCKLIERQTNILALANNLSVDQSEALTSVHQMLCDCAMKLLKTSEHQQRSLTLLGNVALNCKESIQYMVDRGIISRINEIFQVNYICHNNLTEDMSRATMRLLALCTQTNDDAQKLIANENKTLLFIYRSLFNGTNFNLIGNAALIFGYIAHIPSVVSYFYSTENLMKNLLTLIQDLTNNDSKKNVGIFITKLVKNDERLLLEFRNLNGTEILVSSLKNIQL